MSKNKFFQNNDKFIVGQFYEKVQVEVTDYEITRTPLKIEDEIGRIIPNSSVLLGQYVKSYFSGIWKRRCRCDCFIGKNGREIIHELTRYNMKTIRYRRVMIDMEERISFLKIIESTGDVINTTNEHITRYLMDENISKEICSFMNPLT